MKVIVLILLNVTMLLFNSLLAQPRLKHGEECLLGAVEKICGREINVDLSKAYFDLNRGFDGYFFTGSERIEFEGPWSYYLDGGTFAFDSQHRFQIAVKFTDGEVVKGCMMYFLFYKDSAYKNDCKYYLCDGDFINNDFIRNHPVEECRR